jgi:small conductance mechanosensitive channel
MTFDAAFWDWARPVAAVLVAGVAIPAAHWLAMRLKRAAMASAATTGADPTVVRFFAEAARFGLLAGAVILVLLLGGVTLTAIAGGLVAVLIAVGLALQATLANVAAGILIVVQRTYRLGHFVQIGAHRGKVTVVGVFTTEIETLTGTTVTFANGEVLKQPVINFSVQPKRRVDVEVTLHWDTDTDTAVAAGVRAARSIPLVLDDPAPIVEIARLTAAGPQLAVRATCASADLVAVSRELPRAVHAQLRDAGVRPSDTEGA